MTLTCFQILKDVSHETDVEINEYDFMILHNKMYHHSEDLCKLSEPTFSK